MTNKPVEVALAILYREGEFLMQLRDDKPGIPYPGHWGLFGGHLELGETPEEGLKRELLEEINYAIATPIAFGCYADLIAIRHVYHAPLTVPLESLVLQEGWDFALLSTESIGQGSCYSAKADDFRPLGAIHQQILLNFLAKNGGNCQGRIDAVNNFGCNNVT
ncbi:MAG: NUDIX domain-containing protein [Hydrococcus sp. RM1_1_31]|nr:NUDIX domain-containing protein [Hydrococcus sp. RM1_1_31]